MAATEEQLTRLLADKEWRLNNLYVVRSEDGGQEPFRLRLAQREFMENRHTRNIVLKARRLGFSTYIAIDYLDELIFEPLTAAGIIDLKLPAAKKKLRIVKFAWENIGRGLGGELGELMHNYIHSKVHLVRDNAEDLEWSNGSNIFVGTSHRGDALQLLHVSEFGPISLNNDEQAREIINGALPAALKARRIDFESTHEGGRTGRNYAMLIAAMAVQGKENELDFRYHFFPWHKDPKYRIPNGRCKPDPDEQRYFDELEAEGIHLDDDQKAFYLHAKEKHGFDVLKEYPSRAEDAFMAPSAGAIYGRQCAAVRVQNRIFDGQINPRFPVYTSWDIGDRDYTSIWAVQIDGRDILLIDFYENQYEPPSHYAEKVREWMTRYPIAGHFVPHDAGYQKQGKTCKQRLEESGLRNIRVLPRINHVWNGQGGINDVRDLFSRFVFHRRVVDPIKDEFGQESPSGFQHLELYRQKVPKDGEAINPHPVKDGHDHAADALRYWVQAYEMGLVQRNITLEPERRRDLAPLLPPGTGMGY